MKLLSNGFHVQGSWLHSCVSGCWTLSAMRFLWVFVKNSRTFSCTALATQQAEGLDAGQPPSSPCQGDLLLSGQSCEGFWTPQENFSYTLSSSWTQASHAQTGLTVGMTGCCQGKRREVRVAKLNNCCLGPRCPFLPPPPREDGGEQQPSDVWPGWGHAAPLPHSCGARDPPMPRIEPWGFDSPPRGLMLECSWLRVLGSAWAVGICIQKAQWAPIKRYLGCGIKQPAADSQAASWTFSF